MQNEQQTPVEKRLSPAQMKVATALAGGQSITDAAIFGGVGRTIVHDWLKNEPLFNTTFEAIRLNLEDEWFDQVVELRTMALAKMRSLLVDPSTPPAVQLRTSLAILKNILHTPVNKTEHNRTVPRSSAVAEPAALNKTEHNSTIHAAPKPEVNKTEHNSAPLPSATPRNAQCPCGSGDKYKRCCGRNAPPVLHAA